MKFNKDVAWNVILVVSLILIINGISSSGDPDKKTAQVGENQAIVGVGGTAAFIVKKQFIWTFPIVALAIGGALAAPKIFTGWVDAFKDLFTTSATIPGWVWIAAFIVIMLIIISKKK